ncbi:hypothetical protein DM860_005947 [Cuscuta australis]|uniref:Uncharacterized protein n=1 Tax=Cuscuta australis TaxID=267555 RepID=A0A328DWQ3_9ASTE|nr:hypothetical protein DM860_005947 [Cuscuta australis]
MQNVNIVLHDGVSGGGIINASLRQSIAASEPEKSSPADNRHLPHGGGHGVSSQHTQAASAVLPTHKREVENHQQSDLVDGGRRVHPLRPPDEPGREVRAGGQWVVDHGHHPEPGGGSVGGGGLGYLDGGGVFAGDDVVEEEAEVA